MKILYGIQLTGNGHITRSAEIIKSLKARGIEVDIITSGHNSQIELPFQVKRHHKGISFHYNKKNGGIDWIKTINPADIIGMLRDIRYDSSGYDIVISDFEPISAYSARRHNIKSIGIGNQYAFSSKDMPRPKRKDALSEAFLRNFAKCDFYIPIGYKKYDGSITPPVIGEALLNRKTSEEDFYLVYLPSLSAKYITDCIEAYGQGNWRIYSPGTEAETELGRSTIKRPDKSEFAEDLLRCKGVITAAGFSTTSEALVLKKKLWSIPIKGQYEQLCNSIALKEMGVFTEPFSQQAIAKWVGEYESAEYEWENPIEEIVEKIIRFNEEN